MKSIRILFVIAAMLFASATTQAQSLKDILSGIADKVTGSLTSSSSSIVGTWTYDSPDCSFDSESLLAKAGSTVASTKINSSLKSIYSKLGVTGAQMTFNEDGSYSVKIKKKTSSGTYTYDSSSKTITLKPTVGGTITAYASFGTSSLSILFDSSKLMTGLKAITSVASSVNSTASTINSLLSNYNGAKLGFKMKKS